jgi:effector-binding domain-containing protein
MAKIIIKDVPEQLYTAFVKYAAKKGLTLEEAVIEVLTESANKDKELEKIKRSLLPKIKAETIVSAIKAGRISD